MTAAAPDDALAKVILGNRLATQREVDDARAFGQRYHPEKDLAELLLMKGVLDRPRLSLARRLAKMVKNEPARPGDALEAEVARGEEPTRQPGGAAAEAEPTKADSGRSGAVIAPTVDPTAVTAELIRPDGSARRAAARSPLADPTHIGRYEVLERVAQGGMGVVYKARHPELGRIFALKALTARVKSSSEALARFQREAKIAARLDHPNIVRVYDAGTDGDAPYLVMDFVDGPSLEALIKDEGVGVRKAAQVARALALALHHAHERGVVHRDVKPDNVIIDKDTGEPKITDFGIVKDLAAGEDGDERKLTQTGFTLGSPCYMSPEQAAGRHGEVGPRSDIYSLAATLYQMLTGRPPFDGESIHAIMLKVVREEPTPVRTVNRAVPPDLDSICMKALEKDPDRRYATAKDLADDLARFLAEEPVAAKPAGPLRKASRFVRRHRAPVGAVLLVITALAAAGLLLWQDARARSEAQRARRADLLRKADGFLALAQADEQEQRARRKAYYEAILVLEQVLHEDPTDPAALERKRTAVLSLGDHLIESGEASFAEFVFNLGVSVADPAVIASRLEVARLGQWLPSAQEAERTGDLDEAVRLYREGLRTLKDAGYRGAQLEEKLRDLEGQIEARRLREQVASLQALGESSGRVGDHAAALLAYRRALALAPDDGDLAAKVELHRLKANEEALRARSDAQRARADALSAPLSRHGDVQTLLAKGDQALARAEAAARDEDFAVARRELDDGLAAYALGHSLASALHARQRADSAQQEAQRVGAERFALRELGRARQLHEQATAALQRGRHDEALSLYEQAISAYDAARDTGTGKEAVSRSREDAQDARSRAATALPPAQRLSSYRVAEEDFTQAEAHYERGEYQQARELYASARERFARFLELAAITREAFGLRARVRNLHTECDAQRAREFAEDAYAQGARAEQAGDAALDREEPERAVEAYNQAVYHLRHAVALSVEPAKDVRECEELLQRIEALKSDAEERDLTWKPGYRRAMEHLSTGNEYFRDRKWASAKRRFERAVRELEGLGGG